MFPHPQDVKAISKCLGYVQAPSVSESAVLQAAFLRHLKNGCAGQMYSVPLPRAALPSTLASALTVAHDSVGGDFDAIDDSEGVPDPPQVISGLYASGMSLPPLAPPASGSPNLTQVSQISQDDMLSEVWALHRLQSHRTSKVQTESWATRTKYSFSSALSMRSPGG